MCALPRALAQSQGAPNHPRRDAHARAARRAPPRAHGRSRLRSLASRCSHVCIMWEPASAVCAPLQVPSVAAIKSSCGMATFHLFSASLEVRGRRSNPFPPLSRFSRSIHLTSLSRPSTRTVPRPSPSASIRRWSMLPHALGRCYAAESTGGDPEAAPHGSRSTAAPCACRVSSAHVGSGHARDCWLRSCRSGRHVGRTCRGRAGTSAPAAAAGTADDLRASRAHVWGRFGQITDYF